MIIFLYFLSLMFYVRGVQPCNTTGPNAHKPDCSTGHSCMCQALRGRQLAGHPRKIGNTLLKSGPFPGPQTFSSRVTFGPRATDCTPLFYVIVSGNGKLFMKTFFESAKFKNHCLWSAKKLVMSVNFS